MGWSEGKTVAEHQSLRTNELRCDGGRRRLHLVGGEMMFWDTVGMSHHRVILVEAPHAIHFIVDAAGDVLNVLHVGPTNKNTHGGITEVSVHLKPSQFLHFLLNHLKI